MKLIVGLGNPGDTYKFNRHNAGFMMIDYILDKIKSQKLKVKNYNQKLQYDKYMKADIGIFEINDEKIILVKSQTFMNQSGDAVRACANRYSFNPTHDLFVIHDDLDIRLGQYKIQKGKGPKLHNGIASIEKVLNTSDFWRVRIGIDNRDVERRISGETYVLQDFTEEEKKILFTVLGQAFNQLLS